MVAGALGFIGAHVTEQFRNDKNFEVLLTSRQGKDDDDFHIALDLSKPSDVLQVISHFRPDIIINCSGVVRNTETAALNTTITMNILKACAQSKLKNRVIILGSAAEYGEVRILPVDENTPTNPTILYGRYKLQESTSAVAFGKKNEIEVVVARLFNPIGIGMDDKFLIPSSLKQLQDYKLKKVYYIEVSRLDSSRDYLDVRDVATAIKLLATAKNLNHSYYNVGSGVKTTNESLIRRIARELKVDDLKFKELQANPEPQVATQADNTRIRDEFGWSPKFTLEATITEIVAHA